VSSGAGPSLLSSFRRWADGVAGQGLADEELFQRLALGPQAPYVRAVRQRSLEHRAYGGVPLDLDDPRNAGAYSALALSLVPIAALIPSGWPDEGSEERVSGVRLRAAPLSPELYALTGTDDWGSMHLAPIRE